MAICFVIELDPGDTDFPLPQKHSLLTILDLDGQPLFSSSPPLAGWCLNSILVAISHLPVDESGANAFLGGEWVGSTEI